MRDAAAFARRPARVERDAPWRPAGQVIPGVSRAASLAAPAGARHQATRGFAVPQDDPGALATEPGYGGISNGQADAGAPDAGAPRAGPDAGAPAPGPDAGAPPAAGAPCAITSATVLHAPDGTADTRTTVAVSERVQFTTGAPASWTATAGTPASSAAAAATFDWRAPETAGPATITAVYGSPARTCSITITSVLPSAISMRKTSEDVIPAGTAGAGMMCEVTFAPLNVSFGNSAWLEVPGPASALSGYFTAHAGQPYMNHVPNPNWVGIGSNNKFNSDHCSSQGWAAPWSAGTFKWVIPNRIGISGSVGPAAGTASVGTEQHFAITAAGALTVSKQGASVSRSP